VRMKRSPKGAIRFPRATDRLLTRCKPLRHDRKPIHTLREALRKVRKTTSLAPADRSTRTTDPIHSRRELDHWRRSPLHSDAKSLRSRAKSLFGATEPLHSDEKPLLTFHRSTLQRAKTAPRAPRIAIPRSLGSASCARRARSHARRSDPSRTTRATSRSPSQGQTSPHRVSGTGTSPSRGGDPDRHLRGTLHRRGRPWGQRRDAAAPAASPRTGLRVQPRQPRQHRA
jgi:hypothetical protein